MITGPTLLSRDAQLGSTGAEGFSGFSGSFLSKSFGTWQCSSFFEVLQFAAQKPVPAPLRAEVS